MVKVNQRSAMCLPLPSGQTVGIETFICSIGIVVKGRLSSGQKSGLPVRLSRLE